MICTKFERKYLILLRCSISSSKIFKKSVLIHIITFNLSYKITKANRPNAHLLDITATTCIS